MTTKPNFAAPRVPRLVRQTPERTKRNLRAGAEYRTIPRNDARALQRVGQTFVRGPVLRKLNAASPTKDERSGDAYREAGYTVACRSLGFRVRRATIPLNGKPSEFLSWLRRARFSRYSGLSRRSMMRYHDRIVCALAGLQAQRRVARQSDRSSDANGDEAIASELLLRLHGEERERICAFAAILARP